MKYFLLLNFLIGFLFFGCTQKESLKDDFFDFEKIKTIKTLGNFSVKIPGNINIVFDSIHGDLTDKIQWDRVNDNFNLDGTYMMSNNKEFFYFKIGGQTIRNNKTIFTRINWLNNSIPTHGKYNFRLINVPFIQYGSVTVCTIGDSQTRYGEATALRSEINKLFSKAIFVGNRQDIYGYPHEGEGGNNTKKLLERTDFIPKADYYTLLIGTNNWGVKKFDKQLKRAFLDIKNIINEIKKIAPKSKILYITPMPTIKKTRDDNNLKLIELVKKEYKGNDSVLFLPLGEEMRKSKNWNNEFLLEDGLHQNENGIDLMSEMIANKLQTLEN